MIERIYNIILWRIFSFLRGTTKLLNGINPFTWLLQIPFIKKFIIKRGGSIEQIEAAADSVTNDPVMGTNILYASRFMALVSIAWLLNGVVFFAHYYDWNHTTFVMAIIAGAILIICAHLFFVEYKDKYQKYFKTFEKQPLSWIIFGPLNAFQLRVSPDLVNQCSLRNRYNICVIKKRIQMKTTINPSRKTILKMKGRMNENTNNLELSSNCN